MISVGQTLFSKGDRASLEVMDKQIYRLIGKATTLAAYGILIAITFITHFLE